MLEIRRASPGASYQPYQDGVVPWHEAMAATYAHATAPLRRLADRYVVRCVLAIANGQPVPQPVTDAFARLPKVMGRADGHAAQISRATVDLAEAVMLAGRQGEIFPAVVTDLTDRGVRVQLDDLPVVANVAASGLARGADLRLKLVSADPNQRRIVFEPA
jgi:exoribonuclease R